MRWEAFATALLLAFPALAQQPARDARLDAEMVEALSKSLDAEVAKMRLTQKVAQLQAQDAAAKAAETVKRLCEAIPEDKRSEQPECKAAEAK